MTLLVAEDLTTADDDILVPSLFAYAYRLASPSLLFDSVRVQGRVNASPIHRIRKTIEGLLEEYGEMFLSGHIECHLHLFVIFIRCFIPQFYQQLQAVITQVGVLLEFARKSGWQQQSATLGVVLCGTS